MTIPDELLTRARGQWPEDVDLQDPILADALLQFVEDYRGLFADLVYQNRRVSKSVRGIWSQWNDQDILYMVLRTDNPAFKPSVVRQTLLALAVYVIEESHSLTT